MTIRNAVPPGDLPADGDYEVVATFTGCPSELAHPKRLELSLWDQNQRTERRRYRWRAPFEP